MWWWARFSHFSFWVSLHCANTKIETSMALETFENVCGGFFLFGIIKNWILPTLISNPSKFDSYASAFSLKSDFDGNVAMYRIELLMLHYHSTSFRNLRKKWMLWGISTNLLWQKIMLWIFVNRQYLLTVCAIKWMHFFVSTVKFKYDDFIIIECAFGVAQKC